MVDEFADAARQVCGGQVQGVNVGAGGGDVSEDVDEGAVAQKWGDMPQGAHDQAASVHTPSGDDVAVVAGQVAVDPDCGLVVIGPEAPQR